MSSLAACSPRSKLLGDELEKAIQQGMQSGSKEFDHTAWDSLLKKYVRPEDGAVDYAGLQNARPAVDAYLDAIAQAELKDLAKNELLALLINAYNAYTVQLILEHYPKIQSIRDISRPWDQKIYSLGGEKVSLNQIEHNLLRPLFKDARIHFAVNCAAIGCPRLWPEAFTGENIDKQLEEITRKDLTNPRYLQMHDNTISVMKIMSWYKEDFVNEFDSLQNFLAKYAPEEVQEKIKTLGKDLDISFLDYDWNLNSQ